MKFEGWARGAARHGFRGSKVLPLLAAWAGWLLAPACSLLLDAQKKQCESDQDCWARGLDGAVCVQDICQRPAAERVKDMSSQPALPEASAAPMTPVAEAGRTAQAPLVSATTEPDGASTPVQAGTGPQPSAGGMSAAAAGAGAAADGCRDGTCPECTSAADCERRGMPGGRCIDAICWPAEVQCSTNEECVAMGPEYVGGRCASPTCRPNPRWRCEATPTTSTSEQKELTVLVRDSLSLSPLGMVHIVACAKLDLSCAHPVADATTDAAGELHITVPANFAGYLQQTERMEYAPAMYFLPTVFPEDGVLQPFPLLSSGAILDALATSLGARLEEDRGHMMLIAEDCMGMALPGVSFESAQADDKSVQFYVRNLLPSTSETETAEIGNGGFLNFPSGTAVINVDRMQDKLHLTTVSIVVRPMFISVAYMRPQLRDPEVP